MHAASMDALIFASLPSSSCFLHPLLSPKSPNPKPYSPRLSYQPPLHTRSKSHLSRKILNKLHVSTSDHPSTTVPVEDPLSSGDTFEKFDWHSHWYPLAPLCDLDKRAPRAMRVLGLDLVLWWDRTEVQWRVFDDRCPHRLAPLSEGRIDRWGRLQCVYHGWCFNGAGSCELIPQAAEDGPQVHTSSKACAASYPCTVQNKIVWFWPSTKPLHKNILMNCKPPCISELDDPSYASLMGIRDISYGYEILIENLMDPAHVRYSHHKIMRVSKQRSSLARDREGGVPIVITLEESDINGFLAKQEFGYGKFVAPCLFHMFPPSGSNNGSASSSDSKADQRRFLIVVYCIPVSPGRSRLIWSFPRNFSVWIDQIVPRWMFHVGQNLILDSDMHLLHVEERYIAEIGPSNWEKACFVPTKSDVMVTAFRRWFRKYSNSQVDWANKSLGSLLPTPPREQLMDRYWTHVVQCSSCSVALKLLKVLETSLPMVTLILIGVVAASNQNMISAAVRTALVSIAVICFAASKWLSHFIYKTFYFHDYNHAFV
ncbi:protochlorophyllide-dependent translocon component 52, chloroplastic-like isoform X2 [Phalaenopsis equestris]|uniref:protochlorophyllide-dependent translocon component 52, chloroplastic-like isoform X2 n=1 Tax=Phalaenopsis equestris TaxID=78828 RepID=UPI0009E20F44|nr:protochlorophyllide-dependent translocon component 52, chloroplastic-like isoform X2 [Phalaenopsis equestris]